MSLFGELPSSSVEVCLYKQDVDSKKELLSMKSVNCNHPIRNLFHLFILAICIGLGSSGSVRPQSSIKYVYDELGRLIAVTDPAGDTVRYTYDAGGNILSISRQSSSTLSLITFTPGTGPVGTSVTIYGTGFSTTPSQNTVTFNGVTATVSASTATQITTTVPPALQQE
jgi:YD repeat-containing protein